MAIKINHVIFGGSNPAAVRANFAQAQDLGEADLCLLPWKLVGGNKAVVAEALAVFIRLHSAQQLWIRHPGDSIGAEALTATVRQCLGEAHQAVEINVVEYRPPPPPVQKVTTLLVACGDGREVFRQSLAGGIRYINRVIKR